MSAKYVQCLRLCVKANVLFPKPFYDQTTSHNRDDSRGGKIDCYTFTSKKMMVEAPGLNEGSKGNEEKTMKSQGRWRKNGWRRHRGNGYRGRRITMRVERHISPKKDECRQMLWMGTNKMSLETPEGNFQWGWNTVQTAEDWGQTGRTNGHRDFPPKNCAYQAKRFVLVTFYPDVYLT